MTQALSPQLGFLTILQESNGHQGGYLVTNSWGRPLEFRLSSAVQPNRVQQILYGDTLLEYLHADLIGKTLVEKSSSAAHLIITDSPAALALRTLLDCPVLLLLPTGETPATAERAVVVQPHLSTQATLYREVRFEADAERIADLLAAVDGSYDLSEPFGRVREAIVEARKMGGTNRAAA